MFGGASSRPTQTLKSDPGLAIAPLEALSRGPQMKKNPFPVGSVEMPVIS
jgi:hypothetical protein